MTIRKYLWEILMVAAFIWLVVGLLFDPLGIMPTGGIL